MADRKKPTAAKKAEKKPTKPSKTLKKAADGKLSAADKTDVKKIVQQLERAARVTYGREFEDLTNQEKYQALAVVVRVFVSDNWVKTSKAYEETKSKIIYYFSIEFLLGRLLRSNLLNLGMMDKVQMALAELGVDLDSLFPEEADAGLGNGGLGRLAACFLDSMASLELPGYGVSMRYRFGLFEQQIIDGNQVEIPDNWMKNRFAWEYRQSSFAEQVRIGGHAYVREKEDGTLEAVHEGYHSVTAVPYDVPIIGYRNNTVNTLRLWNAEGNNDYSDYGSLTAEEIRQRVNYNLMVEKITHFLYPNDHSVEGKKLRLTQEYFMVSAGVQSAIHTQLNAGNSITHIADILEMHINDTHPALIVAELMRIFVDEHELTWETAWDMTRRMVSYTNHTILPEALEKWPVDMLREWLPRIYMIIEEINRRFLIDVRHQYPGDEGKVREMSIIEGGEVHMARLAVVGSHSVNGVARIHTEILKHTTMPAFHEFYPSKFNNKTNGVTHRRWLMAANPELTRLLNETISTKWHRKPELLSLFAEQVKDKTVLNKLAAIKLAKKKELAQYLKQAQGVKIDPNTVFDIQVKRIHSYKRQLMNIFHVIYQYEQLLHDPDYKMLPTTYLFGGKAAPGYYIAKETIRLINAVAKVVNEDKRVDGMLKVVFITNYNVSAGELVYPAADVSEQISTASKEASGTGNMKFMMNGAITLGTLDGANVEIRQQVGDEHCVIFGLRAEEVIAHYANRDYSAWDEYHQSDDLKLILEKLTDGTYGDFGSLYRDIMDTNDEFFVLKDFDSYKKAHKEIERRYQDENDWRASMAINIARSGVFSSDRTIAEYAHDIWRINPIIIS